MKTQPLNLGWQFKFDAHPTWFSRVMKPGEGRMVDLPHDFRIELTRTPDSMGDGAEGFYPGGFGFYQKSIVLTEEEAAGAVYLSVDGCYRFAEVRLNRELILLHRGGYSPFLVDLTGKVRAGENVLHITCSCAMLPGSRWYTGAGLYRGVELLTGTLPCVAPRGVFARTLYADENKAILSVSTEIMGDGAIQHELYDADNALVAAFTDGEITLEQPQLWTAETPYLYTLVTRVGSDVVRTRVGLRTVSVDAQSGLCINGKAAKLAGGCVHHDNGPLGAVTDIGIERRRVRILKEAGYNAIRCAHNSPSTALLDACDEMGMYVIDEAFDAWREEKRMYDEHLYFETDWQDELTNLITRDRNHPSVLIWSTGNEIYERSGASDGTAWAKKLADHVRTLDDTRPVLNALCNFFEDADMAEQAMNSMKSVGEGKDFWATRSEGFCEPLDVVGYNYLLERYEKDHKLFPARVICGTESFPLQAQENWDAVQALPYVIGDFVWTAVDYIGESGIGRSSFGDKDAPLAPVEFPMHIANCGDIDITGGKRPQSHFRDFVWTERVTPYIAVQHPKHYEEHETISAWGWPDVQDSWTFHGYEDRPVWVTVYSAGDEVALVLNGEEVVRGAVTAHKSVFAMTYIPGVLTAVSYKNGEELSRASLLTAGGFDHWDVQPEPYEGGSYRFYRLTAVDASGIVVPNYTEEVTVIPSCGEIAALASADPRGETHYPENAAKPWQGRLLAVVRSADKAELTVVNRN